MADGSWNEMNEISQAFNNLTANLLSAGMRVHQGNEIQLRIAHAIQEALEVFQVTATQKP